MPYAITQGAPKQATGRDSGLPATLKTRVLDYLTVIFRVRLVFPDWIVRL